MRARPVAGKWSLKSVGVSAIAAAALVMSPVMSAAAHADTPGVPPAPSGAPSAPPAPSATPSPPPGPSGAPSAPGGAPSPAALCPVFEAVEYAVGQLEGAWDANAGSHSAPEFSQDGGPIPDINSTIIDKVDSAFGCDQGGDTDDTTPPSPPSPPSGLPGPSSGGGSPSASQVCPVFEGVEGAVLTLESAWDTNFGSHSAPEFAIDGGPIPDINATIIDKIDSNYSCDTTPDEAGDPGSSTGGGSGSGGNGSGGNGGTGSGSGGTTGGSGGGSSVSTSASGGTGSGSGGPGTTATLASSSGAGGTLPFTGEPSWVSTVGLLALVLGALSALSALALRRFARAHG
jgi:hypothetical protein